MSLGNKIKWVLGIAMIFLLIIFTNLIDKNSFSRVKNSVSTIYNDRIVANDLIFEMSNIIHQKEIAIALTDSTFFNTKNAGLNKKLANFLYSYSLTELTPDEKRIFNTLETNISLLETEEHTFLEQKFKGNVVLINTISKITDNLYKLSKIQLEEGKNQVSISNKALKTVNLYTQIEIYFLIFLAIVIQVIIIYQPKAKD